MCLLGIIQTEGNHWKEQRKFALESLRDFGMGKLSLEGKIQEEVEALLQELRDKAGSSFDCQLLIVNAVSNVICNIVFGSRFDYSDKEFHDMLKRLNESVNAVSVSGLLNFLPFLGFIPGLGRQVITSARVRRVKTFAIFQKHVNEHKSNLDQQHIRDFIDAYLVQIQKEKISKGSTTTFTGEGNIWTMSVIYKNARKLTFFTT